MATTNSRSLRAALFAPVDIGLLVFFRVAFGAIMLWEVWRYLDRDRISSYYLEPQFLFTYYGFSWVQPWPGDGLYYHFYGLGLLAAMICAGWHYRVATTLFFFGFTYVFLLDQTRYLNHFYLVSLISFLLIFVPAHHALSIDAWRTPKLRPQTAPAWALWILRAQIGIAYFYGGIAKLGPDWLAGEPMRTWLANRMDFPVIGPFFQHEWVVCVFVFGGLLLDLLVVPCLLWRTTRIYAFLAAASFHLLNARLFTIGIFPWFMLCATLIFFPPDSPRRLWRALRRQPLSPDVDQAPPPPEWTPGRRALAAGLTMYLAFQILMPLRHHLYPGNVDWTEEGHRFSWHMKLRTKNANSVFLITDRATGHISEVRPDKYLSGRQCGKMATHPDMILQFAHFLADQMRRKGQPEVEVRAQVMASLNGRGRELLVDPEVDLSRQPRTLGHASWIRPLTLPLSARDSSQHRPGAEAGSD